MLMPTRPAPIRLHKQRPDPAMVVRVAEHLAAHPSTQPETIMTERTNLAAYTEPTPTDGYPGFCSLNRETDGTVTLTVRSPGHGGTRMGTVTLPYGAMRELAGALYHDAMGLAGSGG